MSFRSHSFVQTSDMVVGPAGAANNAPRSLSNGGRFLRLTLGLILGFAGRGAEPLLGPRSPPTEPGRAPTTFALRPGFRADLIAAEPLVTSPVAVAVDEKDKAWVVEMRDYSERRPERLGRVRQISDTNQDGRYDHATVFLPDLPWPTAITCWDGGVFVGATPDIIYAKDTDGDGVADVREVVFTGFADEFAPYATNRLNVQALMNSFQWSPDGRIHGATSMSGGHVRLVDTAFTRQWRAKNQSLMAGAHLTKDFPTNAIDLRGRDFSFDPRTLELRPETGGGQHGMSFDSTGRKFVCSNSDHLQLVAFDDVNLPANRFHEMPSARRSIAADGAAAEVFRRSPDEPWRVVRTRWRVAGVTPGLIEGGGRPSGYFTGATGVTIYRGDAYGPDYDGDAFIADCGSNLIHRKKLTPAADGIGLVGRRVPEEAKSEFLASTDNWFRPVQFYNAPDGCLWAIDMYREVIEHPWSLPAPLKAELDLDSGRDRGRIWRMAPVGFEPSRSRFEAFDAGVERWVDTLAHPNGWHRDTAGRLLYQRGDSNVVDALRARAARGEQAFPQASAVDDALGRIQLLYLLQNLGAWDEAVALRAMRDVDSSVRRHAVRLVANQSGVSSAMERELVSAANSETNPLVQFELALALARLPASARLEPLSRFIRLDSPEVRSAAIQAAGDAVPDLWAHLAGPTGAPQFPNAAPALTELAGTIGRRGEVSEVALVLSRSARLEPVELACQVTAALGEGFQRSGKTIASADREGALTALLKSTQEKLQRSAPADVSPSLIRMLAWMPSDEAVGLVAARLGGGDSPEVRDAAITALGRLRSDRWASTVASAWIAAAPELRSRLLALLVSRPEGAQELLRRFSANGIRFEDLDAPSIAALRNHSAPEIRTRARTLLGEAPTSRQAVVDSFVAALDAPGDAKRGAVVFSQRCATCHAWRGQGVALGPDLASVASNGREKLLVAILDPNREVAPNFTAWTAETAAGETQSGLLIRRTADTVILRQAGGSEVTLSLNAVRELRPEGRSLMPEGLEAGLDIGGLADLLAFLTTP